MNLGLAVLIATSLCVGVFLRGDHIQARSIEKIQYGDLTDKEDCIRNYVLSYRDRNLTRLAEVLHEDYVFCGSDAKGESPRKFELDQNKGIFEQLTIFGLDIRPGEWKPVSECRGKGCEGCWETTRGYLLVYSNPEKPATACVATSHFRVVVAPVTADGLTRYKIRAIEDVQENGGPELIQAPE